MRKLKKEQSERVKGGYNLRFLCSNSFFAVIHISFVGPFDLMELSRVSAIGINRQCLAKVHSASTLSPLSLCYNESNHCGSSCVNCLTRLHRCTLSCSKQHNITLSVGVKFEANLRRSPIRRTSFSPVQPCKAISDDSRKAVTGESILMNEQTLERELQIAIEQENYAEAARIRDRIKVLHEDSEAAVLAANARFYNAFRTGDLSSMQNLWAKGDNVCCVHPGAGGISGYDLVMRSWEYVWVDYEFPLDIEIKDVRVNVRGDVGYVTCMELVRTKGSSWGKQFATNVFEKVSGQWLICIHHASPVDL